MAQFLKVVLIVFAVFLICMTASLSTASARQPLPPSSSQEGVVLYWEEKLHHVPMPPMLTAMLTPLTANDARFYLAKLTDPALTGYLPSNAAAFCKNTRIVCDRTRYLPILDCAYSSANDNYGALTVKSEGLGSGHAFFREKQTLVKGAQIELHLNKLKKDKGRYDQPRAFLPRGLVQFFPFSKEGLPQLVHTLGISKQALPSMQETVSECFSLHGRLPGEIKTCPTSLEAMADFVASTMGSQKPMGVLDVSHGQHVTQDRTRTVLDVRTVKSDLNDKYVTCHDMLFPFRVFYCHYLPQTKLFVATLQASDGSIHNKAAVCHYDTSRWNPNHVSFSDLGTKPGESEACHWMADSGLVFLHQ